MAIHDAKIRLPPLLPASQQRLPDRAASTPRFEPPTRGYAAHPHDVRTALSACPSPATSTSAYSQSSYVSHPESLLHGLGVDPFEQPQQPKDVRSRTNKSGFTRSRTGCVTCRTQKKKCDERKPCCSRCKNNKHDCRYPGEKVPVTKRPSFAKALPFPTKQAAVKCCTPSVSPSRPPRFQFGEVGQGLVPATAGYPLLDDKQQALRHRVSGVNHYYPYRCNAAASISVLPKLSILRRSTSKADASLTLPSTTAPGLKKHVIDPSRQLPPLPAFSASNRFVPPNGSIKAATSARGSPWSTPPLESPVRSQSGHCGSQVEEDRVMLPPISTFDRFTGLAAASRLD